MLQSISAIDIDRSPLWFFNSAFIIGKLNSNMIEIRNFFFTIPLLQQQYGLIWSNFSLISRSEQAMDAGFHRSHTLFQYFFYTTFAAVDASADHYDEGAFCRKPTN